MLNKRKSKQTRAPCLCGCSATSSSTIAAHQKEFAKKAKLRSLKVAHAAIPAVPSVASRRHSHQEQAVSTGEGDQGGADHGVEDLMEVDPPVHEPPRIPSSGINRVWAGRPNQPGREDEDLVSEPGSPEVSEDEDTQDGEMGDGDELGYLTDDDECAHVEISARDRLTANYQLSAARAGTFSTIFAH